MLGYALHRRFADAGLVVAGTVKASEGPAHPACAGLDYLSRVDVRDFQSVEAAVARFAPTAIVNATGVKRAPDEAGVTTMLAVNGAFPRLLASFTEARNIYLVHLSTDGVFDGLSGGYDEDSRPNPTTLYSLSKFLGEPDGGGRALTIRTSMIGRALKGDDNLVDWVLSRAGSRIAGFSNVVFSGLPVHEIANFLHHQVFAPENHQTGLFHLASTPVDKKSLIALILKQWSVADVVVDRQEEPRSDLSLTSVRLRDFGGYEPPSWPHLIEAMHEFYTSAGLNG